MRRLTVLLPLLMCGCEFIDGAKEGVEGALDPLVAVGLVLGTEEPDSEQIDLTESDFTEGVAMSLLLADATSVDDLEEAPVADANVSLRSDDFDEPASETTPGTYVIEPNGDLLYEDLAEWRVIAERDDTVSRATIELPRSPEANVPEQHDQGQPLTVSIENNNFHTVLAVVIELDSGAITWSNEPSTIQEVYDFTHAEEDVSSLEIPGSAFPGQSAYAVGIAGMRHTEAADLDELNTLLSSVMAGKMAFYPVFTIEFP